MAELVNAAVPSAKVSTSKRAITVKFNAPVNGCDPSVDLIVGLERRENPGLGIPQLFANTWDASHPEKHRTLHVRIGRTPSHPGPRRPGRLQTCLDSGKAILRVEAPRVGASYAELVRETRRVAGPYFSQAWDEPPLAADADVHTDGIDYADLKRFDDAYLGEVSDHLSFWPRWISAKWRRREMTSYPE